MANKALMVMVLDEAHRARSKFPSNEHLLTALFEEQGELAQAVLKHRYEGGSLEDVRKELIQCMCVLVRLWEEGDPAIGLSSLELG